MYTSTYVWCLEVDPLKLLEPEMRLAELQGVGDIREYLEDGAAAFARPSRIRPNSSLL